MANLFTELFTHLLTFDLLSMVCVSVKICRCSIMKSTFNVYCILNICLNLILFIVGLHIKCHFTGSHSTGKGFMKSAFPLLFAFCSTFYAFS